MNETDADISVSGKSGKMRQVVSECTKRRFTNLKRCPSDSSAAVLSGEFHTFFPHLHRFYTAV